MLDSNLLFSDGRTYYVQSSMFNCFEVKNKVFKFNYQQMNTFEFVKCSKKYVRVSSIGNLLNLVKALLGLMFVCSKTKIGCSSSITNR